MSAEMRDIVRRHVRVLNGVGPHLTLVAPVQVTSVPDLGHAVVRSAVLARPMDPVEAETLHDAWGTIEELVGWPTDTAALEWEARFVRIASRTNLASSSCVETLEGILPSRRRALWLALVAHQRLQELREAHKPGAAGLTRRLEAFALDAQEAGMIEDLAAIVRVAYQSCGPCSGASAGDFPVTAEDVEAYLSWVDHSESTRAVLQRCGPEEIQRSLRLLHATEGGVLQRESDAESVPVLKRFRDQYLAAVYARDISPLLGVDPLLLARAYVDEGHDREQILEAVQELVGAARLDRESLAKATAEQAEEASREPEASAQAPREDIASPFAELVPRTPERPTTAPGINPFVGGRDGGQPHRVKTDTPPMKLPPMPPAPRARERTKSRTDMSLPPLPGKPVRPRTNRPRTRPRTRPFPDFEAMPLPTSSAESQPAAERDLEVAPEATAEVEVTAVGEGSAPEQADARDETSRGETSPVASSGTPDAPGGEGEADALATDVVERGPRLRPKTNSRLVTPGQASRFYAEAFRELQILERDVLERGTWPTARARLDALAMEAEELVLALGPPARSGDV
ncbi:MAG: hypothetical protein QF464_14755, partial [Myxococcota bacterium]|nr:hypothetical protein [Myxococcota bacterium]